MDARSTAPAACGLTPRSAAFAQSMLMRSWTWTFSLLLRTPTAPGTPRMSCSTWPDSRFTVAAGVGAGHGVEAAHLGLLAQERLELRRRLAGVVQRGGGRHRERDVNLALVAAGEEVLADEAQHQQRDTRPEGDQPDEDDQQR